MSLSVFTEKLNFSILRNSESMSGNPAISPVIPDEKKPGPLMERLSTLKSDNVPFMLPASSTGRFSGRLK